MLAQRAGGDGHDQHPLRLLFLIITSNPFSRLLPQTPMDGNDLNRCRTSA
ncbi:hypothetical protein P4118_19580 [Pseudomonas aeruginosa]|nr:hypothetical protein [Pseudomonas aeruginosa]